MSIKINFISGIFDGATDDGKMPLLPAGSAEWSKYFHGEAFASLIFICPCGCSKIRSVPVKGDRKWNWDGNTELPTLTPSILIIGECGWHGYLTKGEWITV